MARKNNIRSIRFSDEMAELIDRQIGGSFTEKFENLITRCVWEAPAAEQRIKQLDAKIEQKQTQLYNMRKWAHELTTCLYELQGKMEALEKAIDKTSKEFGV